jgi:amino acid transporter
MSHDDHETDYKKSSLTLLGAVSMGTGVMIGAGIFALTGQIAELAHQWFPLAFMAAAVVTGFSAYSYIKMSNAWPSAGGIAMFLEKSYGKTTMTGACALLMYFSMVINESLVARTFGTYAMQLFDFREESWLVPMLGVALLLFAFLINILSNKFIQSFSFLMAFVKIAGLVILAAGGLYASGLKFESAPGSMQETTLSGFIGAVALGILAYKGFTTITNSGSEIKDPHRNVGRAIVISISICVILYLMIALAVSASLSVDEIIQARDYSLAEAARPAYGDYGLWFTVGFAVVATVSGVIASVFAVSRMLAMLTDMKLVPHRHFGMPGNIQKHTLVYTIVLAILLTIFFDLSRIASLGAIFYIVMDIAIHWGILWHLRDEIDANRYIVATAILMDFVVLAAFVWIKAQSDMLVVWAALIGLIVIFAGEYFFIRKYRQRASAS